MAEPGTTRVLFVDQSGELGGAELSLLDLVRVRRKQGFVGDSVALLCSGPFEDRLVDASVETSVLPLAIDVQKASGLGRQLSAGPRVLVAAWRLAARARKHDLIYANTQKAAVLGCLAAWFARKPLVWHLRDMLNADHFSEANRRLVVGLTNRSASLVIANSEATARAYREAGGGVPVEVVYNGIDPSPFDQVPDGAATAVRAELGIGPGTPLLGVFGRLTPWKGQHVLIEALADERLRDAHAMVVGEALFTSEDRNYATELSALAEKGTVAGRVHLLGHRDDVPRLMRACHAVVHSAVQPEPFGRVVVEGALAGRPVVAANAGGAAEIIRDGETGLLTTPGDVPELVEAIEGLLRMPDEAERIAQRGQADARKRFGLWSCVARLNELIAAAVKR